MNKIKFFYFLTLICLISSCQVFHIKLDSEITQHATKKNNFIYLGRKKKMELTIIDLPKHAVLHVQAKPVSFPLNKETERFIQNFQNFFYDLKSPFGKPARLAAPQVGRSQQIIIIQIPEEAKKIRKNVYDVIPPTLLINPSYKTIKAEGKNKDWEGCYLICSQPNG